MRSTISILFVLVAVASALPQGQNYYDDTGYYNNFPVGCGHPGYACVQQHLCVNGVVVTDGAGFLQLRVQGKRCYDPEVDPTSSLGQEYHVCCRLEDGRSPDKCNSPGTYCSEYDECTSFLGDIDVRHQGDEELCWADSGRVGICCDIPPLDHCPQNSFCLHSEETCIANAYDFNDVFSPYYPDQPWYSCVLPGSVGYGICCDAPAPLAYCPDDNSWCTGADSCGANAYDLTDQFVTYSQHHQIGWHSCVLPGNVGYGVCCYIPPLPSCPDNSFCTRTDTCVANAFDVTDQFAPFSYDHHSRWYSCVLPGNEGGSGICCTCPYETTCVGAYECVGDALSQYSSDVFLPHLSGGSFETCEVPGLGAEGVCCEQPIKQCPAGSWCVHNDHCLGSALDKSQAYNPYSATGFQWQQCYVNDYDAGVCCSPPYILDYCPPGDGTQACVPYEKCRGGRVKDYVSETYIPYPDTSVDLVQCVADKGGQFGVCCEEVVLYPPGRCGVRNDKLSEALSVRITSPPPVGLEAQFGELPWQAIIFDKSYGFISGAVLISRKHLLTASHNVHSYGPQDLRIRLGEWQVNSFDEIAPYVDVSVASIAIHDGFDAKRGNAWNDVAILELANPIEFSYHINAICMPPQGYIPPDFAHCVVSGWGKDNIEGTYQHILKKVDLPFINRDLCQNQLRKTRVGNKFQLHKSLLCAGGELGKDACKGDGGGPLACQIDLPHSQDYTLIGLTAFGVGCGEQDVPGVYADVGHFKDWIDSVTLSPGPVFYRKK